MVNRINQALNEIKIHNKKLGKTGCRKTLVEFINNLSDKDFEANKQEIGEIYTFFMAGLPTTPKTTEQWVYKATAVDDMRKFLYECYSDGEHLVGTDGHRLHVHFFTHYPKGFYDSEMNDVSARMQDLEYPNWERAIPDNPCRVSLDSLDELTQSVVCVLGKDKAVLTFPPKIFDSHNIELEPESTGVHFEKLNIMQAISIMKKPAFNFPKKIDRTTTVKIVDADNIDLVAVVAQAQVT